MEQQDYLQVWTSEEGQRHQVSEATLKHYMVSSRKFSSKQCLECCSEYTLTTYTIIPTHFVKF